MKSQKLKTESFIQIRWSHCVNRINYYSFIKMASFCFFFFLFIFFIYSTNIGRIKFFFRLLCSVSVSFRIRNQMISITFWHIDVVFFLGAKRKIEINRSSKVSKLREYKIKEEIFFSYSFNYNRPPIFLLCDRKWMFFVFRIFCSTFFRHRSSTNWIKKKNERI